MFNETVLDHFRHPRNVGELPAPALTVEATNPVCGDILRLWLLVREGRISAIRFKAKGCVASIAAASYLTTLIEGKSAEEAGHLQASEIAAGLGGLPPESGHAAILAEEALRKALPAPV